MPKAETRVLTAHVLVGRYQMRYEIQGGTIYILRIWHTREDR
ncbi:hypothetical protein [Thauera sp. SDU_THAU2]